MSRINKFQESLQRVASHSLLQAGVLAAGIGLAIGLAGCGSGGIPASSQVYGAVSHEGKPVTQGVVNFFSADTGKAGAGNLTPEGKYEITAGLAPGKYKVYVTPPPITAPPMPGAAAAAPRQFPDIPDQYRSDSTSTLSFEVKAGKNEGADFKLD